MAPLAKTNAFWKTIKQISVTAIGREAEKPVRILALGSPEEAQNLATALLGPGPRPEKDDAFGPLLWYEDSSRDSGFPGSLGPDDIVVDLGGGLTEGTTAPQYFHIDEVGGWERLIERILDMRPDLWLALGRRFPALRRSVAERVIHETSVANAEFAMLNAIPGVIPIIAPLLPATAVGDILLLTKNQMMMMYRIAAAHGLPLDLRARSRDLAPLLGNALGWRALARELIAVVPGGVGLVARGAIAYAGTAAVGRALLLMYQTGKQPTRAQITRFYKEAYAGAKKIAAERLHLIRSRARTGDRNAPTPTDKRSVIEPHDLKEEAQPEETSKPG